MSSSSPSPALRTAQAFLSTFTTVSASSLAPLLSPTYTHTFAPSASLLSTLPTVGPLSRSDFLAQQSALSEVLAGYPLTVKEIFETVDTQGGGGKCVVLWAGSRAVWREEVKEEGEGDEVWGFEGEYVYMLWMDEKGEKVERGVEFVDSQGTLGRFLDLLGRARGRLDGRKTEREGGR